MDILISNNNNNNNDPSRLFNLCIDRKWNLVRKLLPSATENQLQMIEPSSHCSVLEVACWRNAPIDIVMSLIKRCTNASNNDKATNQINSCFKRALLGDGTNNNYKLIEILLHAGANPNQSITCNNNQQPTTTNEYYCTPLHIAVEQKNIELVTLLLQHGSNPNIVDVNLWTPLHIAMKSSINSPRIVQLLLDYNADVNLKTNTGSTILHIAAKENTSLEIVSLLLLTNGEAIRRCPTCNSLLIDS
jgi:ankyrin repeat protein